MRTIIAGMKVSLNGMTEGPEGHADWVEAWSEDYGLTPQIDACLLGGGMFPGYEKYWGGIQQHPDVPAWITGEPPTAAERDWAAFITRTPSTSSAEPGSSPACSMPASSTSCA
jgi:hypothetical protein